MVRNHKSLSMQVWDAVTGSKQYTCEGHEAPVYSVCPHTKENIQVYFYSRLIFVTLPVVMQGTSGGKDVFNFKVRYH